MRSHKLNQLTLCGSAVLVLVPLVSNQAALAKWKPLGSGMNNTVYTLTVYNGELIAGGNFGGDDFGEAIAGIARWNGTEWLPLGDGIGTPVSNGPVYALTVYNGDLIAGGGFQSAGGQPAHCIARWDGKQWHPLGNGMSGGGGGGGGTRVESLTVYNGELIAGGDFTIAGTENANYVARWNNEAWDNLHDGAFDRVQALAVYDGTLMAGGEFLIPGGQEIDYIAAWNGGVWQPLTSASSLNASVLALTVHDGELVAGGTFAGGQGLNGIARWNGAVWQALGNGISGVNAVASYRSNLIAGFGHSFEDGFGNIFNRIASWDGSAWNTMHTGMNRGVLSLTVFGDQVIAGGDFTFASNQPANRIARWAPCPGDATQDDVVNINDLLMVINFWGPCSGPPNICSFADVSPPGGDGSVNVNDLLAVITAWGPCP